MLRRFALLSIALGFLAAAAAIATVSAIGNSGPPTSASSSWTAGRQSLSKKVDASRVDSDMSEYAKHVLGSSSAADARARVPLQLDNGARIEAGLRANGSLCFDVTPPGRIPASVCGMSIDPNDISGVINEAVDQPIVYAGLAGDNVSAVDVITDQGTISATLQNGAFYSSIPSGSSIEGWVVTLADGSKVTHNWPPDPTTGAGSGGSSDDQSN